MTIVDRAERSSKLQNMSPPIAPPPLIISMSPDRSAPPPSSMVYCVQPAVGVCLGLKCEMHDPPFFTGWTSIAGECSHCPHPAPPLIPPVPFLLHPSHLPSSRSPALDVWSWSYPRKCSMTMTRDTFSSGPTLMRHSSVPFPLHPSCPLSTPPPTPLLNPFLNGTIQSMPDPPLGDCLVMHSLLIPLRLCPLGDLALSCSPSHTLLRGARSDRGDDSGISDRSRLAHPLPLSARLRGGRYVCEWCPWGGQRRRGGQHIDKQRGASLFPSLWLESNPRHGALQYAVLFELSAKPWEEELSCVRRRVDLGRWYLSTLEGEYSPNDGL